MIAARLARFPLGRIVLATRGRWRRFLLSALLAAVTVLSAVGLLTVSGYLISRAAEQPEILSLTAVIVWIRIFGFSRALFRYAERLVSHDLAFRSLADLRRRFFERLIPLVPGGLDQPASADLLSRFVGDVDRLQDLYLRALSPPVVAVATGLVCVGVAALMLPVAALVLAVMLLFGGIAAPGLTRWAARVSGRRQARARAALSGALLEVTTGSAEIAVAGREEDWLRRAEAADRKVVGLQKRDALNGGIAAGLTTMLAAGAAVAVTAVAVPAVDEGILNGVLLAALALLAMASFEAVMPLGPAAASLDSCVDAAGRIEEVTERPSPVIEPPEPLAPPASGPLCFERVSFSYGPDLPVVLDRSDFRVSPGEAVALVGPSGAGKSTIAELMVRFRDPDEGRITLGGVDLRALDSDRVRETVRLAPQDSYLFTGTLGENVALGMPSAGEEEISGALEWVGLGSWLAGLEDGLGTFVGEGGSRVSGGQRQRIAAARCLLGEARFMVFDEPTAHLDPDGARSLETALVKGRTRGAGILVITHAISDPANFDRVLVLDESRSVRERDRGQAV
jgi:ATP-binding cassette, subfamily C, bacterial CydC